MEPLPGLAPLHASTTVGPLLLGVLTLAGLGSALLLGLGLAAYVRRRSRPYLLVALALATIAGRSLVAWFAMMGPLTDADHHLAEHGLDVVMTALVVGAVWYAREIRQGRDTDDT
ncbi:DUF7471 family protein [Haloarchaeobius sp. DYHT-AS-18]|uniref:DUF7471 family protein n=1 Tax=Haloarchaeobius sp. DYHT-AS-18 TaxID=3446117 RepID=UPI003EBECDD3